jgi:hypothetical protein
VKLYDRCFHVYDNALIKLISLQSCVNMVFRHDWRPPSFSFINLAFTLHWLVYKFCMRPTSLAL